MRIKKERVTDNRSLKRRMDELESLFLILRNDLMANLCNVADRVYKLETRAKKRGKK